MAVTLPKFNTGSTTMFTKEFLQDYSLYAKFSVTNYSRLDALKYLPSLKIECPKCQIEQTFNIDGVDTAEWMGKPLGSITHIKEIYKNKSLKLNYQCKGCNDFLATFSIQFSEDASTAFKVGQYPAKSVDVDNEIKSAFGEHLALYRKGLICESQGYGIAAFAYYRRIIELTIKKLMDEVLTLVESSDLEAYKTALNLISDDKTAEDKIKVAADMLPVSMKPSGHNPIKLIYEMLSVGIHGLSDDDCLGLAKDIRTNIEAFVHSMNVNKNAHKALSDSTKKLLEKRNELQKKKSD